MNIDIHCHASSKPFMKVSLTKKNLFKGFTFEPESKFFRKTQRSLEQQSGVMQKTQSHFDSLYQGGIRVACISITPLEKGFCIINGSQVGLFKSLLKELLSKKKSEYLLSPKPINALSGYDIEDINYIQDELNDYYEGLFVPELEYLFSFANESGTINGKDYVIKFPKNAAELNQNVKNDKNLNLILSIEGMHSLMRAPENRNVFINQSNHLGDASNQVDTDMQERFRVRINELKSKWISKPIFVSLNHHFWNRLGGHASSLGKDITTLVSQNEGLHTGLTTNGQMVVKELLLNNPIYIDIKHMSALCRKHYYQLLKNDSQLRTKQFPIICSHTGITSISTLDEMIRNSSIEANIQANPTHFLYQSNINLCHEELTMILDSKGILGIQLDEKRISGKHVFKALKKKYNAKNKNLWQLYIKLLWANIFEGVRALNTKSAWDIFSIGSDYDGLINHLDEYPRASDMNTLRNDMLMFLDSKNDFANDNDEIIEMDFSLTRAEIKRLMFNYSAEEIVTKIFEGNAMSFFQRWFK